MKQKLAESLRALLPNVIAMYIKSHGAHWIVIGKDFRQYHDFFGDIYGDVYGSIDPLAENIRKLGYFPMFSIAGLNGSVLPIESVGTEPAALVEDLLRSNEVILAMISDALVVANEASEQGILNFLADRQDMHQKWGWQLRASVGRP